MEERQKAMQEAKPMINMTREEFDYSQKPIGKALYKNAINNKPGRPATGIKAMPTDRLKCDICGKEYFRSGSTKHKRTVYHTERAKLNKKLIELLIDD